MKHTELTSLAWFRKIVDSKDLHFPDYEAIAPNDRNTGKMILFKYDPKTKDSLPYYDTLPIIIHCGRAPGGFYGMNLHYLPVHLRVRFMDRIGNLGINKKNQRFTDESLRAISQHPYFKPCIKRYLNSHVLGKMVRIPIEDWDNVALLPLQKFRKAGARIVWEDTKRTLNDHKPDQT
jgi:hypothetical protein